MRMHALFNLSSRCFSRPLPRALLLVGLISISFVSVRAVAAEIVVQNTPIPPKGQIEPAQEVGERIGARLTSPIDGTIVGVQLVWGSLSGLAAPSQETAIRISAADGTAFGSTLPSPGTVLATISNPILIDGGANEFRFLDPGSNLTPLSVPILAGEDFFVDLEMLNVYLDLPEANRPGMYSSLQGVDIDRNVVHLDRVSTYWTLSSIGIAGARDWGFRAIIQPVPEPSTYALAAMGVVALLAVKRRKSVT